MTLSDILKKPKFCGTFLQRLNRFVVFAELEGKTVQAYLPNPGKLLELLLPGERLILVPHDGGNLPYLVLAVLKDGELVLLHTHLTNHIVANLIEDNSLPPYEGYRVVAYEQAFLGSRFDLLLEKDETKVLLEIKTCTLFNRQVAMFPDAVSERGTRHLLALSSAKEFGFSPECLFVVMSRYPDYFLPAYHIDFAFAKAFLDIKDKVRLIAVALSASESLESITFVKTLGIPFDRLEELVKDSGVYLLVLEMTKPGLEVGALGRINLKPGYYVYVGIAKVGLQKRIERHKRKVKALRWHIDYLTRVAKRIWDFPIRSAKVSECELADMVRALAPEAVPKFGSSDCKCQSHLFYFKDNPLLRRDFVYLLTELRLNAV